MVEESNETKIKKEAEALSNRIAQLKEEIALKVCVTYEGQIFIEIIITIDL